MSLTTVAATLQPDEELSKLPSSHPERFERSDFIAAAIVFLTTLGVYIATLAPNVTLEDSGELITAAATFGVGHPPGYPLWTMSGFLLSHLLPFGNMAWKMNLLCALFGATSNAVLTLLVCHSGRWLLQRWAEPAAQPVARKFCFYAGLFAGLTIGFSEVMWSQAVISAVHGTLNALFMNLVLILFYFWMIAPEKTHRLILTVFVFSLGLTNHHTLVQIIPAFLIGALIVRAGKFWSVFIAVNLFSLSILVYISWLSGDEQMQTISQVMAKMIFVMTAVISFFYMKQFRLHLYLLGVITAIVIFGYGYYLMGPSETDTFRNFHPGWRIWEWGTLNTSGWLQGMVANAQAGHMPYDHIRMVSPSYAGLMLLLAALALGLLYTSTLDRRLVIGVFIAGWIGLVPYSYERLASSTNPPMNWGFASDRSGFYYEVSREQYPKSLPVLIKSTFGKLIGVVDKDQQLDATIGLPDYFPRLGLTFYFYGYSLQNNFTVPLIFLTLAVLLYWRRCDSPQSNWFIFLGVAFFFVGFMLQLIAPQEAFDFQHNLSYKVFHLQSHCILVILMSYGVLGALIYLHGIMPEVMTRTGIIGFGLPTICLSLLPLWSNFDHCSQAGHWFGYYYGSDIVGPMDKNAVYFGGTDPGRFVPTYTVFVESQQDNRWKAQPGFDRRDVTVITQNALCDSWYSRYIRNQYDPRFRPKPEDYTPFEKWLGRDKAYPVEPVYCQDDNELLESWHEFQNRPDVYSRVQEGGPSLRMGTSDVFEVNAIVAQKIFEKNKKKHTFYLEQCVALDWAYPYLLPSGLILKINPDKMTDEEFAKRNVVDEDRKYWDAYSQKLLQDGRFHIDDDAKVSFGRLAFWHADLYRFRHMEKEEEYWLRMSLELCPQLPESVDMLTRLLVHQQRFDDAIAVAKKAIEDDPFSTQFSYILDGLNAAKTYGHKEENLRSMLAKSPYDVTINLDLARMLELEGKYADATNQLRVAAGLTNWTDEAMAGVIQYYVEKVHDPDAAIAFLEARAAIDPKASRLVYNLAALHATLNHTDQSLHYLAQSFQYGDSNAVMSARIDPRFGSVRDDPRFQALIGSNAPPVTNEAPAPPTTNAVSAPATNQASTKPAPAKAAKPVKK